MSENLFTLLEDRIRRSRDDRFVRKAAIPNIATSGADVLRDRDHLKLLTGCTRSSATALAIRCHWGCEKIEPALGSASSSPTIRYSCTRPSSCLKVTVLPKATVSVDEGWARRPVGRRINDDLHAELADGRHSRHLRKIAAWWAAIAKCSPLCSPLYIPLNRRIC
jgi:hypothetical protein